MRILFTGASSFTGYWFVQQLVRSGHEVWATFRRSAAAYDGVRHARVARLESLTHEGLQPLWECEFGDAGFLRQIAAIDHWDCLCHHAADVTNYKSPEFDVAAAVASNTRSLPGVLAALRGRGCRRVVLTGSVFEPDEGAGEREHGHLRAFSPYGLSKGLTAAMLRYYVPAAGMQLGKFVIPNPFGPYEEPRFTAYLVKTWVAGAAASVKTPAYVRDNIHVSLLARVYADFVGHLPESHGFSRLGPCGYVETQGAFAERFAREMRPRLDLPCELNLSEQTEFSEPRVRINTDIMDATKLGWNEQAAWDELAEYYRKSLLAGRSAGAARRGS